MWNHSYFKTSFYLKPNAEELRNKKKTDLLYGVRKKIQVIFCSFAVFFVSGRLSY